MELLLLLLLVLSAPLHLRLLPFLVLLFRCRHPL